MSTGPANIPTKPPRLAAFVALLDRCKAQVAADPSGYRNNPHLYYLLDKIHLRLCHGNRAEYDVTRRGKA